MDRYFEQFDLKSFLLIGFLFLVFKMFGNIPQKKDRLKREAS